MPPGTITTETTPLEPAQIHYQWIQRVYVLLDDYDRVILEKHNLNKSEYRTLLLLDQSPGKRLTTISEKLLLSKSTITRVIDVLEGRGWVERIPDHVDRRALRVVLTAEGARRRDHVYQVHQRALDEIFQALDEGERESLDHLLKSLFTCLKSSMNGGNSNTT